MKRAIESSAGSGGRTLFVPTQTGQRAQARGALDAAARLGLDRFNTGRPCRHGHLCDRYVLSGACIQCQHGHAKAHRLTHRNKPKETTP